MPNADTLKVWGALQSHHAAVGRRFVLPEAFSSDPSRFKKFSFEFDNPIDQSSTLFDFSKNFINDDTLRLFVELGKEAGVEKLRDQMFRGEHINTTEDRAVYHAALRNTSGKKMQVDGKDVMPTVDGVLAHMKDFSEQIRSGEWKGYTGKKLTTIINIGIGGSDLFVFLPSPRRGFTAKSY
jgi:glucose-6-phosphate isomerase